MQFNTPIARTGLPKFHESSGQRSLRDSDAVPRQWQKNQITAGQTASLVENIKYLQQQLNRLRRRAGAGEGGKGMIHRGEWSATETYEFQNVVQRGVLGTFVCFEPPAAGVPPETGAPHWLAMTWPSFGSWA